MNEIKEIQIRVLKERQFEPVEVYFDQNVQLLSKAFVFVPLVLPIETKIMII